MSCAVCNHRLVIFLLRCIAFVVNSDCLNVLYAIIVDMCFDKPLVDGDLPVVCWADVPPCY